MKKILSIFLMLMVISSVTFARRANKPGASSGVAVVKSGDTFKLYYKGAEPTDVKISILDSDDKVVFSETLKKVDGFVRPYNFSKLSEGAYTIQISDKHNRHSEKINVEGEHPEKLAHVLKVAGAEEKYLVTVSNKELNDITVKIYDSSDNVIYNQVEAISTDFAKIYNLKKYSGEFTFEVTDGNGVTQSIKH